MACYQQSAQTPESLIVWSASEAVESGKASSILNTKIHERTPRTAEQLISDWDKVQQLLSSVHRRLQTVVKRRDATH